MRGGKGGLLVLLLVGGVLGWEAVVMVAMGGLGGVEVGGMGLGLRLMLVEEARLGEVVGMFL